MSSSWQRYAALGDSLTAGRGDSGPDGRRIGWAMRLAQIITSRTGRRCELTNLAVDGADAAAVLGRQLPRLAANHPDLVSLTVGMNDLRVSGFAEAAFASTVGRLFDGLTATGATILTCTLPDVSAIVPLPPEQVAIARARLKLASEVIHAAAANAGAVCLDLWGMDSAVADPELFTSDRLHPNPAGHSAIAAAFADLLLDRGNAARLRGNAVPCRARCPGRCWRRGADIFAHGGRYWFGLAGWRSRSGGNRHRAVHGPCNYEKDLACSPLQIASASPTAPASLATAGVAGTGCG